MQNIAQSVYRSSDPLNKYSHFHDGHQIVFVVKGEVRFCINNRTLCATTGDVAIFSRYENHSVLGCSDDYERFVLLINPDVATQKSAVYSLLTDRPVDFCNIISVHANMTEIIEIFHRLSFEHNSASKLSGEMEQLLIKQLLIIIYRCMPINFDYIYDEVATAVKWQFENAYHERYSLDGLAKQYNISISSLSHRFKTATGVSVMNFLQSCRMANVKQMLAETDYSIEQIVEKCGFSDSSNFSRTFKKLTGLSPTDFRKKYKAE